MKQENKETKQESPIIRDIVLAEVHPDLPEEDIDELVRNFDASNHEPPVTIGHTVKDSDPAYGWIKKVWKRGRQLWGTVEFIRDMADLIKRGLFKNRSISYYTNYEGTGKKVLRHLAILGAAPPRIKGMPAIQFKEKKAFKLVNFVAEEEEEAGTDDSVFTSIATNFRAMVDWLNGIMETQQAQLVMENFCLLDFQYAIESAKEQAEFLEIINNKIKELDMGDEKATLFAMENLKEEIKNLREEKAKVQVENHVDTLIKEGKLKPADKENLIKTYCELGDEQRNALMELDKNRTKVIEFGELEGASGEGKRRNKETEAIKKHFPNLTDEEIKTYGG